MSDEVTEKKLRQIMKEEIAADRKANEPVKIVSGVTDDEIAAAIRAAGEGETWDCPHVPCDYKGKEAFAVCPKCKKPVVWG